MTEPLSIIDKIILEGMRTKSPAERIRELEHLLETGKLVPEQIRAVHKELTDLKKRMAAKK